MTDHAPRFSQHYHGYPEDHMRAQAQRCRELDEQAPAAGHELAVWLLSRHRLDTWASAVALGIAASGRYAKQRPLLVTAAAIEAQIGPPGPPESWRALADLGLVPEDAAVARQLVEQAARWAGAERVAHAHLEDDA